MFRIEDAPMTYIARFVSPSARRIAYPMFVKRMRASPKKTIWPYSVARPTVSPAPNRVTMGPVRYIRGRVSTAERMMTVRMA